MRSKKQHHIARQNPFMSPNIFPFTAFAQRQYSTVPLHLSYYSQSLIATSRGRGKGKWSTRQQKLYINYLQEHIEDMKDSVSRKTNKVFLRMSRIIWTRSADQCRSHHQKILKFHNSLENIISTFKRRFASQERKNWLEKTRADDASIQGFYELKRSGNSFTIIIEQSAIQLYQL